MIKRKVKKEIPLIFGAKQAGFDDSESQQQPTDSHSVCVE
jgi:hypothetical protein